MVGDGRGASMKTEQEIREWIAEHQREIDEEEREWRAGGAYWSMAVTARDTLRRVLGE